MEQEPKCSDPEVESASTPPPKGCTVFLASPGDVDDERARVRNVIERVRHEELFRGRLSIDCIAWDQPGAQVAMDASLTPQEAIKRGLPKPSACDLVVVVFWSRMGTPLPVEYSKADGSRYLSGTEWEYVDAVTEARRSGGRPAVWVYRRTEAPSLKLDDPQFDDKRHQWQLIEAFFKELKGKDGSLIGGLNPYRTPDEFEKQFEQHFRDHLTKVLQSTLGVVGQSKQGPGPTPSTVGTTDLETAITLYRQKAETLHATLPMAGFATRLKVPINIQDIYVPLRAMMNLTGEESRCFQDAAHAEKHLRECNAGVEISLPQAFEQLIKRNRKGVVILGDPGSGKTTHLRRLLLWCLREGPAAIHLPCGMLPVFLPLRELRDLGQGLDAFIQEQLRSPNFKMAPDFGERLLRRGNLLFLLDGLDEVADPSQRKEVARWIEDGALWYPDCRFVVTCRFAGYIEDVQLGASFLELHIRPLSEGEVEAFVTNWYRIVERELAPDPEQAEQIAGGKAKRLIERLKEPDFRARRVFELTRNPLLLTNICLVHRHREALPQKRARLYEECIDVLLERWQVAKRLKVGVTAQQGRRALQPVALWLHSEEGRTRATAPELAPSIEPVLKAVGWAKGNAEELLRTIRDESGLLTGWDADHYGFLHLGFQEYLAAREIRSRAFEDPEVLRELAAHFGESWWQEVTLLLLALEDPSLFVPFMREVVRNPIFAASRSLVDLCLDDAAEKSSLPFVELLKEPAAQDQELWKRQQVALQVLEQLDPTALEDLLPDIASHPSPEIRRWAQERWTETPRDVFVSDPGGYELVQIPGGVFSMGAPESEGTGWLSEQQVHQIRLADFYMGRYPVTNEQYGLFLKDNADVAEPKYWADRQFNQPRQPVVGLTWDDARRYAAWAGLRLPSEAEWEYACRAGSTTRYYTGETDTDLDQAGWYAQNSGGKLHLVGEKEPNEFGLYDMHGNVWEWVEDDSHKFYEGIPEDGSPWIDNPRGSSRVLRGGSFGSDAAVCRSTIRDYRAPGIRSPGVGFRLSRSVSLGS